MKTRKKKSKSSIPVTEVELCEALIERARFEGYDIFPEVSDWDIVLVDSEGTQLGIQAKMHANVEVLYQATRRANGPHHRAVLVPKSNREFGHIARQLRINVFSRKGFDRFRYRKLISFPDLYSWKAQPLWLPPVPSEEKAGSPSPKTLTKWRVKAIRLCILLESQGYLTGQDFKVVGISQARWLIEGWLMRDGNVGRFARYVRGPASTIPITGFEVEAEKMKGLQ